VKGVGRSALLGDTNEEMDSEFGQRSELRSKGSAADHTDFRCARFRTRVFLDFHFSHRPPTGTLRDVPDKVAGFSVPAIQ